MEINRVKTSLRLMLAAFIIALILSGITAFAIETGVAFLLSHMHPREHFYPWLNIVFHAIKDVNERYPFMAYGYDWLAFAHLVIAVAFIGPLKDPVRNIWVIEFGRYACIMILPLAFIAGNIRQVPLGWQLIDCSFGVLGYIPLTICYRKIRLLESLMASQTCSNIND